MSAKLTGGGEMKRVFGIFIGLFLLAAAAYGEIVEINQMDQVYNYLKPNTLVIFDIDNTIIEPVQTLGSDQWFGHRISHWSDQGLEPDEAVEKALSEWMAVQNITKVKLVEPETARIIKHLQDRGFTVMGLTTRGLGMSTRTNEQLKSVGVHLETTAPTKDDVFFMNERGVLMRGGTLFTANTHKGEALFKFLDKINVEPKMILFINDKRSHIVPMKETASKRGVPFIGLRYNYLDEKVKNLNAELTDIQFEHFGRILSDEEAAEILQEKRQEKAVCPN